MRASWPGLVCAALALGCDGASVVGGIDASAPDATSDIAADLSMDVTPDLPPRDAPVDVGPARCARDEECRGNELGLFACDLASGRCVACTPGSDRCPMGQYCDPAALRCASGCRDDMACAAATADGGVATARCDPGTRRCVACVTDAHCPPGTLCVGNTCVAGCSATQPCPPGALCCGGACVDPRTNVAHCGACGMACAVANAAPACADGSCVVGACSGTFADCDAQAGNGCETNTESAVEHCGGCGMRCPTPPNARAECASSRCAFTCLDNFADCDGDATNGCETDTRGALAHCGRCGNACPARANGAPVCAGGACGVSCATSYGDCDGDARTGCETDTRASNAHCGACGTACATGRSCQAGVCCGARERNCGGACRNLNTDNSNCGACGVACGAGTTCVDAVCESTTCLPTRACAGADCDACGATLFFEDWSAGTAQWRTTDGGPIATLSDMSACAGTFMRETVLASGGRTFLRRGIAVRPGRTHCLSAWVRGSANTQPFLGINASDANGTVGNEHWLIGAQCYTSSGLGPPVSPVRSNGEWRWYAREFVMPSYTFVVIKTEIFSGGSAGTADFDGIQLIDGPCPQAPIAVCARATCD